MLLFFMSTSSCSALADTNTIVCVLTFVNLLVLVIFCRFFCFLLHRWSCHMWLNSFVSSILVRVNFINFCLFIPQVTISGTMLSGTCGKAHQPSSQSTRKSIQPFTMGVTSAVESSQMPFIRLRQSCLLSVLRLFFKSWMGLERCQNFFCISWDKHMDFLF